MCGASFINRSATLNKAVSCYMRTMQLHRTSELYFLVFLKFLSRSLKEKFLNIYQLLTLSLFVSMDSAKDIIRDLLSFLTDSWLSSLSSFGVTFAAVLEISKAFDKVWHKFLLFILPSCGFYPSLWTFIFSFLFARFIPAVVTVLCSNLS